MTKKLKRKKFFNSEFARLLGIHEFTLIKWEGSRLPHQRYLEKLKRVIPGIAAVAKDLYQRNVM